MKYDYNKIIERGTIIKKAINQGLVAAYVNELDGVIQGEHAKALNSYVGFDLAKYNNELKELLTYHSLIETQTKNAGSILEDPSIELNPNKVDAFERKTNYQEGFDNLLEELSRATYGMQR